MAVTIEQFEFYLCILVRISAFIYTAPFFNLKNVPRKVKTGMAMVFSLLLFEVLPYERQVYGTVLGFTVLVGREALAGLIMGFFANACYHILAFAGHVMDMEIGFSMMLEYDPVSATQVTVTANLYTYAMILMMLITDMHHHIIEAIADSFRIIPVGGVVLNPGMFEIMVDFVVQYFIIGFRIVLPMFATILILNVVLGILARVAPQMNMFVIGLQLKVFVGLIVLVFMINMLPAVSEFIFGNMMEMLEKSIAFLR